MSKSGSRLGFWSSRSSWCGWIALLGNVSSADARHPEAGEGRRRRREELPVPATPPRCRRRKRHDLNDAGKWLVAEKDKRGAKTVDGAWLKDYPGKK